MPTLNSPIYTDSTPTCLQKMKHSFAFGFAVGMLSSMPFASFAGWKYGLQGRELYISTAKMIMQGAGTFAALMGMGAGLRC